MKRWEMRGYNSNIDLGSSGQVVARGKFGNLSQAMESAQFWVIGRMGRSSTIVNRTNNKIKMRYWFDGNIQFMDY